MQFFLMKNLWSCLTAILLSTMFSFCVQAQKTVEITPESQQLITKLKQEISNTLLTISQIETAAGNETANKVIYLEKDARSIFELGMMIDTDYPDEGLKVTSVTKNSAAESVGIKINDMIVKVNDVRVSSKTLSLALSQLTNVDNKEKLIISFLHKNKLSEVSILVNKLHVPSYSLAIGSRLSKNVKTEAGKILKQSCGRISVSSHPLETRFLFPASIHTVDGDQKIRGRNSFVLPVGKHTVYLHEKISSRYISSRGHGAQQAKGIEIDVQANATYHLAAKFNPNKKLKVRKGEYWQPVVWKKSERSCVL